jgi:hypothetical protein
VDFQLQQWLSPSPARRLRIVGAFVLIFGVTGALSWTWARGDFRGTDELLPGYSQARLRQNEILMGSMVAEALQWIDALRDPHIQSMIMAGVSVLVAIVCFRVAALMD